jgi:hypothetical protein
MKRAAMCRRSVFIVQLTFYLLLLSAAVRGQAVVPNPADIAPVINPPNPQTNIVISLADFMGSGVSTHQLGLRVEPAMPGAPRSASIQEAGSAF